MAKLPLRPQIRSTIDVIDVGGESLTYDPERNEIAFLTGPALAILELCDGTATVEQTATELAEAYGAPVEEVEPDVRRTVEEFARQGLLEGVPAGDQDDAKSDDDLDLDERGRVRMQVPRST